MLQSLLTRLVEACRPLTESVGRWHGHRTWLVDGTGVSMPDTQDLQRAFGQPSNQAVGCGFPVARVLALFHGGTGLLQHFFTAPLRSHEMARVTGLHPELRPGDVLVGDRAFGTFAHLALLVSSGLHGVFRMGQRRVVDFTPNRPPPPRWNTRKRTGKARSRWVRALGPEDQIVKWYKPYQRPSWMSAEDYEQLPLTLTVRECRYQIDRPGFRVRSVTLVTTLLILLANSSGWSGIRDSSSLGSPSRPGSGPSQANGNSPAVSLLDAGAYPVEALADLYYTARGLRLRVVPARWAP